MYLLYPYNCDILLEFQNQLTLPINYDNVSKVLILN